MHFAYDGFTQEGNRRCFLFRIAEERATASPFLIQIDLGLLLKNRVPMQEAPMFCLNLLTEASLGEPGSLDRLRSYTVVEDDFRELNMERQRRAADKLFKKPFRQPVRKHSNLSNLHLGSPSNSPFSRTRTGEPVKLRSPLFD